MRAYLRFLASNGRFVAFGFVLAALSGSGQTYLISLYGAELRATFDLSNAAFGALYSGATLTSGVALLWLGRQLDRVSLPLFTTLVLLGAVVGCALLAGARNAGMVAGAFLILRICGQGLMMHTAQTTMARRFERNRGKAISLSSLGMPAGEAVFPALAVAATAAVGWRATWAGTGVVLLVALPAALWLMRGRVDRAGERADPESGQRSRAVPDHWRAGQVVRDWRFHALLTAVLAAPFILTFLFFHQVPLAQEKGWALSWLASSFVAFAVGHIGSVLLAGPLVDRFGGRRLVGVYLVPMACALLVVAGMQHPWSAPVYLALAGISMGLSGTLMGAIWPELYGTRHLGAIRSMVQAAMVFSTALAPVLGGLLIDAGVPVARLALALLAWVVLASVLSAVAARSAA